MLQSLTSAVGLTGQTKLKIRKFHLHDIQKAKKPYHGYVGQANMVPLFESMGIDDANVYENVESMTNIMWPHGNPSFRHVPIKI